MASPGSWPLICKVLVSWGSTAHCGVVCFLLCRYPKVPLCWPCCCGSVPVPTLTPAVVDKKRQTRLSTSLLMAVLCSSVPVRLAARFATLLKCSSPPTIVTLCQNCFLPCHPLTVEKTEAGAAASDLWRSFSGLTLAHQPVVLVSRGPGRIASSDQPGGPVCCVCQCALSHWCEPTSIRMWLA